MTISKATKELTWLKTLPGELNKEKVNCTLYNDRRQSSIYLEKNPNVSFQDQAHTSDVSFHQRVGGLWYTIAEKSIRDEQSIEYADKGGDHQKVKVMRVLTGLQFHR